MKAFFSKIWAWIVSHKVIAIVVASVIVVGSASAIILPIALHQHSYSTEWTTDETNHWHDATCGHEEKAEVGAHEYDNACDTTCGVCGYERTVGAHEYDNACDADCNVCGATRTPAEHAYDNACDTTCNVCEATRTITHDYADTLTAGETTHWYACSVCGDKKDEAAHVFDKTVASSEYLKEAATATTKAQYYKSCECGAKSATEYFEADKAPANLQISDISKTYDGTPVAEPTVMFDGVGAENFAYYKGAEKLTERPTNAGTYKVVVTVDETETHAGDSVEQEFTIAKKVLSNLTFAFDYSGESNFTTAYLTEAQGILAADVADGIFIFVQFNNKNVGATVTDTEIDFGEEADSYKNYEIDMATFTASIVKRAIWAENVVFTYNGANEFYGDEAVADVKFENAVSGEINPADIVFEFSGSSVGNALKNVKFDDGIPYAQNYTFDLSKCAASITPRTISGLKYDFAYNASDYFQVELKNADHGDILANDGVILEVVFASENVGAAVLIDGEMAPCFIDDNYVLGEYNFAIVKKVVTELPATLTAEYKSNDGIFKGLEAPVEIDGIEATLIFTARKSDNNLLYNPGAYGNATLTKASLGDNFDLQIDAAAKYTITVTPKKISALDIKITETQYNKGEFTLIPSKDGVYHSVKVIFSKGNTQDVMVDAVFDLILDADHFMQGREVVRLANDGSEDYYCLTPDANGFVGTITIVANCDVQYDGSCNCGTSHIIGDAIKSENIRTTLPCATTWNGGVYKITTEAGYWSILPSDNFANITAIYDSKGNAVAIDGNDEGFYAEKDTYYVHISKASNLNSAQNIMFTYAYTLKNYPDNGAAESAVIAGKTGDMYFFRIEADAPWGASMNIYADDETMDSANYEFVCYDQYFNELTDVIYDGTDVYHSTDDNYSVMGKVIYIGIMLKVDTNVQVYIY